MTDPKLLKLSEHYTPLQFGIVPVNGLTVSYRALSGKEYVVTLKLHQEFGLFMAEIPEEKIVFVFAEQEKWPAMETK